MNPVLGFTSCFSNVESIPMLNGSNFSEWKERLLLVLALMDLDISLREERPDAFNKIETERWDRSNRMSMMIMKDRIPSKFRGIVPEDVTTAKEALAAVEKCYAHNKMGDIKTVAAELFRMKEANESVRESIMMKMTTAAKLKKLGMPLSDNVLADMVLDRLPLEYDLFKETYRSLQVQWSTHDLISQCVQEEERLKWEKKELDLIAVLGYTSCFSNVESIPMLNGSNFSEWKEHVLLVLALMDLDISVREERPDAFNHIETERWDRSNRMSMMIMRIRIPSKFKGIVPEDVTTAKEVLAAVEKCYENTRIADDRMVTAEFLRTKEANESVREYIMMKMNAAAIDKKLGLPMPDYIVADKILESLPSEYNEVKINRHLQKRWSTHYLISQCVQEEERLKMEK